MRMSAIDESRLSTPRGGMPLWRHASVAPAAGEGAQSGNPKCLSVTKEGKGSAIGYRESPNPEHPLTDEQRLAVIGRLTAGVAHDFKNLLTAILLFTDLLASDVPKDSAKWRYAAEIRAAVQRGNELIGHLLSYARGKVREPKVISLKDLVNGMSELLQRLLGTEVAVTLKHSEEPLLVRIDPAQLEQVLLNLALNARDAMPEGGRLTIETGATELHGADLLRWPGSGRKLRTGKYAQILVKDTGCGMDEATRVRAFEPFFTTKKTNGTGLGLSIVQAIVAGADGAVLIDSLPGAGSTVTVLLPRAESGAEAGSGVFRKRSRMARSSGTILLVMADDAVRTATAEMLQQCGYRVAAASNGKQAEAMVADADLLVADAALPGESGYRMAERLRRLRPNLRALYLGGNGDAKKEEPDFGMEVIEKPFSRERLALRIQKVLKGDAAAGKVDARKKR
jgi:two-component system cell cycle sensor histidine kinase/response regulator CckA